MSVSKIVLCDYISLCGNFLSGRALPDIDIVRHRDIKYQEGHIISLFQSSLHCNQLDKV